MATVKWELEDLSFAILHPKKYEEIVRLVADRAPSRDTYLAKVRAEINATLNASKINATRRGPAQALLVDLPEDDRQGPRLRRHPRPGRGAHPVRRDPRLLRRCGRGAFAVAADGRAGSRTTSPSRGTGCTSRCTPPSSGPRASRWRCRSAPTTCTTPPSTASPRTGATRKPRAATASASARRRRDRRHGLDASAARLAAGGRRPRRVPGVAALRPCGARDLRVHAEGRPDHAARRVHAGRLRLRGAHRGRPPLHRRAGQRPAGGAGAQARKRRQWSRFSRPRRPTPGPSRDWQTLRGVAAGEGQDPAVVRQGAPRGGAGIG